MIYQKVDLSLHVLKSSVSLCGLAITSYFCQKAVNKNQRISPSKIHEKGVYAHNATSKVATMSFWAQRLLLTILKTPKFITCLHYDHSRRA